MFPMTSVVPFKNLRLHKFSIQAVSKKRASKENLEDAPSEETVGKVKRRTQKTPRRSRKKTDVDVSKEKTVQVVGNLNTLEESTTASSSADSKKPTRVRGRKKATTSASSKEEDKENKTPKRRTRKNIDPEKEKEMSGESSDEESTSPVAFDDEMEEIRLEDEGEDISFTYSWPPLVCCFGAAQDSFIPSGRPADRLIDREIHESKKDMFWTRTKFVRAPGSSPASVAIALASIGGRVAFMGKLGDDEYGHELLYHLNFEKVQTRSVVLDISRPTAASQMKMTRRGGLRMSCVKPCAEDNLRSSEINIDVLKEAKMFYFNSSSLLDKNMRRTTLQAVKASKKLGGVIFFDLNLPLPLWESSEDTKTFIQQAWESAEIIEITKQELEFLCGITPNEKDEKSKFIHYEPEAVKPLWHENLKVLFVTNGTSKMHYYTEKGNGWVRGMEDAPITPFTGDMSVSGDAIVAALMRMLTVQPHLITDKGYLEHMIKYAIDCGVIDQWLLSRVRGFPPKQGTGTEDSSPSEFGAPRSITEREYRMAEDSIIVEEEPLVEEELVV